MMEVDNMLVLDMPEEFKGIKLCKKSCNECMCCHKSSDKDSNNGYYCFNPKNALFVRHARTNRKGISYGYGNLFCCVKIVIDGQHDMFSSSEKELMTARL